MRKDNLHVSFLLFCFLALSSCGLFKDSWKSYQEKGYTPGKDTVDIKPCEVVIIRKGYIPVHGVCDCTDTLNARVSVKGFEHSNSLPLRIIKDTITLIISDPTVTEVTQGTIHMISQKFRAWAAIRTVDSSFKASFGKTLKSKTKVGDRDVVLLMCIKVKKDGKVYTLPSRGYGLTE